MDQEHLYEYIEHLYHHMPLFALIPLILFYASSHLLLSRIGGLVKALSSLYIGLHVLLTSMEK